MRTWDSVLQEDRSRCVNFGHEVTGDSTKRVSEGQPLSSSRFRSGGDSFTSSAGKESLSVVLQVTTISLHEVRTRSRSAPQVGH
mmetsp:Transcript_22398/g.27003  ORF Transcript_22398/g.27003 Transcript_22398/m.27003 type:complete len:84 (-) Transcript_22398:390-641(-)